MAWRRALGQSGDRSGFRPELDPRRRRISERRGVQSRRRGALCAHPPLLRPPDHRSRRRHAKGRRRGQPVQRLANGEPAGAHRRQVRRHRHFRHQQIRSRSAQRLYELGADRHRHLRLRLRRLGFYLRRRRRVVPGRLDGARRPIRSVGRAQRHRARPAFRAVPMGRRDRAPLRSMGPAGQGRGHRIFEPRPHGQLQRCHRARGGDRRRAADLGGAPIQEPRRLELQSRAADHRGPWPVRARRHRQRQYRALRIQRHRSHRGGRACACRKILGPARRHGGLGRRDQRHFRRAPGLSQCRRLGHPDRRRHAAASGAGTDRRGLLPIAGFVLQADAGLPVHRQPGLQRDRGPASVVAARMHAQF